MAITLLVLDIRPPADVHGSRDGVRNGGGQHGIQPCRQRDGVALGQGDQLGVAAVTVDADPAGEVVADRLSGGQAAWAAAAEEVEVGGDALALPVGVHADPGLHHGADQLVTGDPRQVGRVVAQIAANAVEHGQADRAGLDPDQQVAFRRPWVRDLLDPELSSPLMDPAGPHDVNVPGSGDRNAVSASGQPVDHFPGAWPNIGASDSASEGEEGECRAS